VTGNVRNAAKNMRETYVSGYIRMLAR
jgi:hypothetical protein